MKITYLMILAAIVVFVYSFFAAENTEVFFDTYGFSGTNLLARPYTIITSIFMHASLLHLLSNILVWVFFGAAVEDELKKGKMLAIFFGGAFAGALLSLLFYPLDTISVGASAGIFALVGVGMLVRPMDMSFYPLVVPLPLAFIGMLYALFNVYEFVFAPDQTISYVGHFGGLAVGLLAGFQHGGVKKGLKIIFITLGIMVLIPLLWVFVVSKLI